MSHEKRIIELRELLHRHNYNYYIKNAPEISDIEFDTLMRELQDLEALHPELDDDNSPTRRVGSDLTKEFAQVTHKYPMLSLGNTYSKAEVADFYDRVKRSHASNGCCATAHAIIEDGITRVGIDLDQSLY